MKMKLVVVLAFASLVVLCLTSVILCYAVSNNLTILLKEFAVRLPLASRMIYPKSWWLLFVPLPWVYFLVKFLRSDSPSVEGALLFASSVLLAIVLMVSLVTVATGLVLLPFIGTEVR